MYLLLLININVFLVHYKTIQYNLYDKKWDLQIYWWTLAYKPNIYILVYITIFLIFNDFYQLGSIFKSKNHLLID